MFIADDVILFPFKSILSVFQEIYNAAVQEIASEADAIPELSQLYLALEAGSLTEEAFDAREGELLDRLDEIEERGLLAEMEDDEDDDDEESDDLDDDEESDDLDDDEESDDLDDEDEHDP